ncbi:MAG: ABC transporter permease [Peptococcaceae bacterium]
MAGFWAVLWREYLFFKRRFKTITTSSMVSPLLYLLTFGLGLGKSVHMEGVNYLYFLVPGIIAISTMNTSFGAIATPLSIARLYDKTLEEYMIAPITNFSFAIGKIVAGALRGLYAAAIILLVAVFFGVSLNLSPLFIILLLLNCLVFSSLGFLAALKIKSHPDMARFNNFFITPMVFVCGTFFSLENVPQLLRNMINLLPLTPASYGLRAVALNWELPVWAPLIQVFYLVLFTGWGIAVYHRVE